MEAVSEPETPLPLPLGRMFVSTTSRAFETLADLVTSSTQGEPEGTMRTAKEWTSMVREIENSKLTIEVLEEAVHPKPKKGKKRAT